MSIEQVRPILDCFCQILSLNEFSTISSNVLYAAKFDRNDATVPLWKLIFEIIRHDEKFDQIPKNEIVERIKGDLYKRGYTYEQFLSLDNNMGTGSRQLLICVGWLIYHSKLIEKCMKQYLNSISNLDQVNEDEYDPIKQIKEIRRTNIKIRSRLRNIEHVNLQDHDHISSFERQLCQYPHLISQYLSELDQEYQRLSLFLYWNKHENIFWKWMESVLDQPMPSKNTEVIYRNLKEEKKKFNQALDALDSVLIRLKELWLLNDDRASVEGDITSIVASIDLQISALFNQLLNPNQSFIINSE